MAKVQKSPNVVTELPHPCYCCGFFVIQMLGIFKRVTGRRGIKNVLLILTAAFHEIPGKKVLRVSLCVLLQPVVFVLYTIFALYTSLSCMQPLCLLYNLLSQPVFPSCL